MIMPVIAAIVMTIIAMGVTAAKATNIVIVVYSIMTVATAIICMLWSRESGCEFVAAPNIEQVCSGGGGGTDSL